MRVEMGRVKMRSQAGKSWEKKSSRGGDDVGMAKTRKTSKSHILRQRKQRDWPDREQMMREGRLAPGISTRSTRVRGTLGFACRLESLCHRE